jgi:sugar/nucleoside kinase (ribokinase family)
MVDKVAMTFSSRVVVVGDIMDDVVAAIGEPMRPNTDTPASIKRSSGGSAANTAVWLGSQGVSVDFFGQVGLRDLSRYRQEFIDAGVEAHLSGDEVLDTGSIVIVARGEDRSMLTDRGANVSLNPAVVTQDILAGASALHLTGYSFFHHEDPAAMSGLITRAIDAGLEVMVDASSSGFLSDFGVETFLGLVAQASILRCNEDEALLLSGARTSEEALAMLSLRFPRVIITRGAQGSLVWEEGKVYDIPPHLVAQIRDATGAGDAFNAGILAGCARAQSIRAAAVGASELAARCVTHLGARP